MAAIRREVVRSKKWLDDEEFLEVLSIAQLLPGANPPNVAVLVGSRLRGALGATIALTAGILPGFAILMLLATLIFEAHLPGLGGALRGCAAAAVGLTLANAIELTRPRRRVPLDLVVAAAVAIAVLELHASLWVTLLVFVPLSLLVPRPQRAR